MLTVPQQSYSTPPAARFAELFLIEEFTMSKGPQQSCSMPPPKFPVAVFLETVLFESVNPPQQAYSMPPSLNAVLCLTMLFETLSAPQHAANSPPAWPPDKLVTLFLMMCSERIVVVAYRLLRYAPPPWSDAVLPAIEPREIQMSVPPPLLSGLLK